MNQTTLSRFGCFALLGFGCFALLACSDTSEEIACSWRDDCPDSAPYCLEGVCSEFECQGYGEGISPCHSEQYCDGRECTSYPDPDADVREDPSEDATDIDVADTAETDTAEADTAETDTAETDTAETDTAETDTAEADTAETDTTETDTTETDTGDTDVTDTDGTDANLETACTAAGGSVATISCCASTTPFPDLCSIGACGCAPASSADTLTCDCGEGRCFDGTSCVDG